MRNLLCVSTLPTMKPTVNRLIVCGISLFGVFASVAPAFASCTIGQTRTKNPAVVLAIFASNCFASCDEKPGQALYTVEHGWIIKNYSIQKVKETGYASDIQVEQFDQGTNVISGSDFTSMQSAMGQVNAVDPNTGQPIQVGGSYESKTMEQLHEQLATNKNTIKLSATVRGKRGYGANGRLTANLITEEVCIGTRQDYLLALQKEVESAKRWNQAKPDITINLLYGNVLKYYRDMGKGIISTPNGQVIKTYSGWRTSWSIISPIRENMVIFYEAASGHAEIYHVDEDGTFRDLYQYNGWSKDITNFTNAGNHLVRLDFRDGKIYYYRVEDNGMFFDDHPGP